MKNFIDLYSSTTFNGLMLTIFQNRGGMASFFERLDDGRGPVILPTLLADAFIPVGWLRSRRNPGVAFLLNYRSSKFSA